MHAPLTLHAGFVGFVEGLLVLSMDPYLDVARCAKDGLRLVFASLPAAELPFLTTLLLQALQRHVGSLPRQLKSGRDTDRLKVLLLLCFIFFAFFYFSAQGFVLFCRFFFCSLFFFQRSSSSVCPSSSSSFFFLLFIFIFFKFSIFLLLRFNHLFFVFSFFTTGPAFRGRAHACRGAFKPTQSVCHAPCAVQIFHRHRCREYRHNIATFVDVPAGGLGD